MIFPRTLPSKRIMDNIWSCSLLVTTRYSIAATELCERAARLNDITLNIILIRLEGAVYYIEVSALRCPLLTAIEATPNGISFSPALKISFCQID